MYTPVTFSTNCTNLFITNPYIDLDISSIIICKLCINLLCDLPSGGIPHHIQLPYPLQGLIFLCLLYIYIYRKSGRQTHRGTDGKFHIYMGDFHLSLHSLNIYRKRRRQAHRDINGKFQIYIGGFPLWPDCIHVITSIPLSLSDTTLSVIDITMYILHFSTVSTLSMILDNKFIQFVIFLLSFAMY